MGLFTGLLVEAAAGTALKAAGAAYMGIKEKVEDGPHQKKMEKILEDYPENRLLRSKLNKSDYFLDVNTNSIFKEFIFRRDINKEEI